MSKLLTHQTVYCLDMLSILLGPRHPAVLHVPNLLHLLNSQPGMFVPFLLSCSPQGPRGSYSPFPLCLITVVDYQHSPIFSGEEEHILTLSNSTCSDQWNLSRGNMWRFGTEGLRAEASFAMFLLSCPCRVEAGLKELQPAWVSEHSSLTDLQCASSLSQVETMLFAARVDKCFSVGARE